MNLKAGFFDRREKARVFHHDTQASASLAQTLLSYLPRMDSRPIVFVCIGTDRSTGDSLGPLVGTLLEEKSLPSFYVYGTLEEPVHAVNLNDKLNDIYMKHLNPYIIGIDACLGRMKNIGMIQLNDGPVKPGAGVNKDLPSVGNIHITGIVNVSGFMEFFVLQNTRLHLVMNMAKTIANGIYLASLEYPKQTRVAFTWPGEETTKTIGE